MLIEPQDQQAQAGDTVVFTAGADGVGPLSFRWRRNDRALKGQTNATLILTNLQASDEGKYSIVVSHQLPWGRVGIGSSNAVLTVIQKP